MVIDYISSENALTAQGVLTGAGIASAYTPHLEPPPPDEPEVTPVTIHRLEVDPADADRARQVLVALGLLNQPGAVCE